MFFKTIKNRLDVICRRFINDFKRRSPFHELVYAFIFEMDPRLLDDLKDNASAIEQASSLEARLAMAVRYFDCRITEITHDVRNSANDFEAVKNLFDPVCMRINELRIKSLCGLWDVANGLLKIAVHWRFLLEEGATFKCGVREGKVCLILNRHEDPVCESQHGSINQAVNGFKGNVNPYPLGKPSFH